MTCPHVRTSGVTQWCALAEKPPRLPPARMDRSPMARKLLAWEKARELRTAVNVMDAIGTDAYCKRLQWVRERMARACLRLERWIDQ